MRRMVRRLAVPLLLLAATAMVYATASYPNAVKSFSTKLAGQTISAAHINDIQDEIVAVENALLNGFSHALTPASTGSQDLGTTSKHWGTIYVNTIAGVSVTTDYTCGRLTLTTGVPVTTGDVTAATTLYYTPNGCDLITLYDGVSAWNTINFTELSIAVPATTSTVYDVWVYNNSGVATLELLAWTNTTSRATAIVRQNGRYVKSAVTTRRYVGTFETTTSSGQTEDSAAKRYVWNYYNRVPRVLQNTIETTDSWTYTTKTWRQARATATNQVNFVVGVAEVPVSLTVHALATGNSTGTPLFYTGIGLDSTSAIATGCLVGISAQANAGYYSNMVSELTTVPAVGFHFAAWLEASTAVGSTTWFGDNGDATFQQTGMVGTIPG